MCVCRSPLNKVSGDKLVFKSRPHRYDKVVTNGCIIQPKLLWSPGFGECCQEVPNPINGGIFCKDSAVLCIFCKCGGGRRGGVMGPLILYELAGTKIQMAFIAELDL